MKFKVSVLPHDNLINNEARIHSILDKMKKFLLTPSDERGSFDGVNLIHDIADLKRDLACDYKYTNEKPVHLSSILYTRDEETIEEMKAAGLR